MEMKIRIHDKRKQDLLETLVKQDLKVDVVSFGTVEELMSQVKGREEQNLILLDIGTTDTGDFKKLIKKVVMALSDVLVRDGEVEKPSESVIGADSESEEMFEFTYRKKTYTVALGEIHYFESDKREVYLRGLEKKYHFYAKLDDVEKRLAGSKIGFIRANKSFLVNTHYIREYQSRRHFPGWTGIHI